LWKQIAFKQDDILNTQDQDPRYNVLQFVCFLGRNARHSLQRGRMGFKTRCIQIYFNLKIVWNHKIVSFGFV
jgi:hypothetical protein